MLIGILKLIDLNKKNIFKRDIASKAIFLVPFSIGKIKENSIFYTNTCLRFNKKQILSQANKAMAKGNYLEAAEYYKLFLSEGYIDPNVFSNYGTILQSSGQLDNAIDLYKKSINLFPQSPYAYSNIGTIYKDLGKLKESEFFLRKAIELKPSFVEAYFNLGNTIRASGNYPEAILNYKKALEFNQNYSKAKSVLIESKAQICDWSDQEKQKAWLDDLGIKGGSIEPMTLMYSEDNAMKHLIRAQNFYQEKFSRQQKILKNKKIKKFE